jgi:Fe-S-cluster containining protein
VYLVEAEARAIADHLGIPWSEFEARSLVREDGWLRLATNGPCCPFLAESGLCRVYPVRPMQCRTWPFWKENLVRETWEKDVRSICPGIGKGRLVSPEEIDATAAANEAWYEGDGDPSS